MKRWNREARGSFRRLIWTALWYGILAALVVEQYAGTNEPISSVTVLALEITYSPKESFTPEQRKVQEAATVLVMGQDFAACVNGKIFSFGCAGVEGRGENDLLILASRRVEDGILKDSFGWPYDPRCALYLPNSLVAHLADPQVSAVILSANDHDHSITTANLPKVWPLEEQVSVRIERRFFPHVCIWRLSAFTNINQAIRLPTEITLSIVTDPSNVARPMGTWLIRSSQVSQIRNLSLSSLVRGVFPLPESGKPKSFSRLIDLRGTIAIGGESVRRTDLSKLSQLLHASDSRASYSSSRITRYWPLLAGGVIFLTATIALIATKPQYYKSTK